MACLTYLFLIAATTALPVSQPPQPIDQAPQYVISATSGPEGTGCNNEIIDSMIWRDKSASNGCVSLDYPAYCVSWNSSFVIEGVQVFDNHGCRTGSRPNVRKSEAEGKVVLQSATPIYSFLIGSMEEKKAASKSGGD